VFFDNCKHFSLKQVLHSVWQRVDSNWLNTESDTFITTFIH
jgi:hypothetical protein